nr:AAA family ATPase [uncultured Tyzzerella sp.]
MKPQILKITGINSFNEIQQIDFSKILEKGMFGIFGDTGSGKSTIIDCITLALYGKIVRYDGKNGNGDFLNLGRNNGKVEFIFSIKNGKDEIFYEVVRQFKRTNKGDIKSDIIRFSIFKDSEKEILADKKKDVENYIINLLGLSYEDFTKAVVLPQGKFSEFLMLENSDKRKMLQRIFSLEKYGDKLKDKINEKKSDQENIVNNLKKEIEFYGEVSLDNINQQKYILKEKENLLSNINIKIENIEKEEKYFNNILKLKENLAIYKDKLEQLIPYKDTVLNFEKSLNNILEAEKIAPHILELDNILKENEKVLNNKNALEEKFKNIEDEYKNIEKKYNYYKIKKDEDKPKLDKIKQDLQQCINFINEKNLLEKDILNINEKLKNISLQKDTYSNKILAIENKKFSLKEEIGFIIKFNEENKIDNNLKEDLKKAIRLEEEKQNINNKIDEIKESLILYDEKIQKYEDNILEINKQILNIQNIIKSIIINNINNLENKIENNNILIKNKENENENIQNNIKELNIQIKIQENKEILQDLAKNLINNKPCPLCGSKEHPQPINIILDNIIATLNNKKAENENIFKENEKYINNLKFDNNIICKTIENIKNISIKYNIQDYSNFNNDYIYNIDEILKNLFSYEDNFNSLKEKLNAINISKENIEKIKDEKIKELENNNNLLNNISDNLNYYYKTLNTKNFDEKYSDILNIENTISENNEKYLCITKQIDNIDKENNVILNNLNNLEKDEIFLQTKKEEKENTIKDISIKIKNLSYNEEPNKYILNIEKQIEDILLNEEKYKNLFDKLLQQKNILEKNINDSLINLKINEENISKKSSYIDEFIQKSNFQNSEQVLKSYNERDKKQFYEEKIKSYKEKYDDYSYNIKRIEEELQILNIDKNIDISTLNEDIKNICNEKQNLLSQNKELIQNITTLKINISQKEEIFEKIEKITKIIKEEEKKLDLLKELSDLNKGGIFVEYVANRYLKHIVLDASKRLFNMSRSKYSLELLDNNFVIKDNYNGGIIRSPRSLSGGEVFMASLSLALSLSSKIQLKNNAPLEIFFLDEGFGTLDNNTLDVVINTLEELQTSNISVGIITHIDEIKNRVQNKINVISSENGTKIIM